MGFSNLLEPGFEWLFSIAMLSPKLNQGFSRNNSQGFNWLRFRLKYTKFPDREQQQVKRKVWFSKKPGKP